MKKRFLITTCLDETWPTNKLPVLFLGEWCKIYNKKSIWIAYDLKVVPYHWNNKDKFKKDYKFLGILYEEFLKKLSKYLNKKNNVDYSIKFWRILIGPWLGWFIQAVYDRWFMVKSASELYEINEVTIIKRLKSDFVPNDMKEFIDFSISDEWNELIYGECIKDIFLDNIKINFIDSNRKYASKDRNKSLNKNLTKSVLKKLLLKFNKLFTHGDSFYIRDSYLSPWDVIKLNLILRQLPKIDIPLLLPKFKNDFQRDKDQFEIENLSFDKNYIRFTNFLSKIILSHIPKSYLEGFNQIKKSINDGFFPKEAKLIFTSNLYWHDDYFKYWSASKVEEGVPLIIGQHGGNIGNAQCNFQEDHSLAIAYKFISWGWNGNKKNFKLGNLKLLSSKEIKRKNPDKAVMVQLSIPIYSYYMFSFPISSEQLEVYFKEQIRFVDSLSERLRGKVQIRLSEPDFNFFHMEKWQDHFPKINFIDSKKPLKRLYKNTRLFICTYNATTFLEFLALNIPTLIFWNPEHAQLRKEALYYFNLLENVGILHKTPESAAKKMSKIWDNVESWWQDPVLQESRNIFCERYSLVPQKGIYKLSAFLNDNKLNN